MNNQAIEKYVPSHGASLDVHSIFLTIQGEGPFAGERAIFIRLAGCNLQCPMCDTEYTQGRTRMTIAEILMGMTQLAGKERMLVVITGGEPFRQNIIPLVAYLESKDYFVQIETNGTLATGKHPFKFDISARKGTYIVCSPKTGKVHISVQQWACAFKYVIDAKSIDPEDGLPTLVLGHTANPKVFRAPKGVRVYVQPMDEQDPANVQRNLDQTIASCLKHGYTLQLQIHKLMGLQ